MIMMMNKTDEQRDADAENVASNALAQLNTK